ncbi:type II secretion system protein [Pontiella sulfatireligans]|uniref:Type II secretion system protein I n=1 Tax=Pontiella sulfatireligans TaxID=2750658 RepID=A0A6C2US02_9BACT|nr:prepilin-type N-terminal cleavage/methylation domain-containing protein [Pontiella sulfatireligans]VGO23038.1 hypothetical protein SCARR_05137 [Pontiella sulfatireligans]
MKKLIQCTRKRGFTLIEIMLALLVITVGIVAASGLLGTSLDSAAKSHDDLNIVSFSDMVLNYCHAVTNWSELPPDGTLAVPDYDGGTFNLQQGSLERFECPAYTVSYKLEAQTHGPSIKALTLQLWPGYTSNGTARVFYTEIYNWADK